MEGLPKLPFEIGIGHYDEPLPEQITELEALRRADAFRFANELRAFIEVDDGRITSHGHLGAGHLGATTLRLGPQAIVFQATAFPELRPPCAVMEDSVTFVQTAGGRPSMPLPRTVASKPYLQLKGPTVWTTLSLTIFTDRSSRFALTGASPFPRHWVYDPNRRLAAKSATIDFSTGGIASRSGPRHRGEAEGLPRVRHAGRDGVGPASVASDRERSCDRAEGR